MSYAPSTPNFDDVGGLGLRKPEPPSVHDETLAVEISDIADDDAGIAMKTAGGADKPAPASAAPTKCVDGFADPAALQAWVNEHGVKTVSWGLVAGSKSVEVLLAEVKRGETSMALVGTVPTRIVRFANVRVLSDDRRHVLVLSTEVLADGTVKERRQPLSKKLPAGAAVVDVVSRGAVEELGIEALTALPETQSEYVAAKSASGAFPGLPSRYEVVVLDATVAEGSLKQTEFSTKHAGKTYHWEWHPRLALPAGKLVAHDFSALWNEKQSAHMKGTREWAFAEIIAWLDDPEASQLLWYMGGGGTGKSVLSAELLRRVFDRTAAWHFCRFAAAALRLM